VYVSVEFKVKEESDLNISMICGGGACGAKFFEVGADAESKKVKLRPFL